MPRHRPTTLRDVAREAGVSIATASNALNGKGRIGPDTRERVLEVARSLEFRVDPRGRALRVGTSQTVGLLLPTVAPGRPPMDFTSISFYAEFAAGAAHAAFEQSYALVLLPPPGSASDLDRFGLDGLLVCDPAADDPRLAMADSLELPVVCVEPEPAQRESRPAGWVGADNAANARLVMAHLADRGARSIALVVPAVRWAWVLETKAEYQRWCLQGRQEPQIVESSDPEVLGPLLSRNRPDAVFALSEIHATATIKTARAHGIRVPEDLLVAAGVDGAMAQVHDPPITAVDLQPRRQARLAVERLLAFAAGLGVGPSTTIEGRLRVRASSGGAT